MKRKEFLKTLGLGTTGLMVTPIFTGQGAYGESQYLENATKSWTEIRKKFPLDPKINYLNNGTMGVSPRPVLDKMYTSLEHIATTGQYPTDFNILRTPLAETIGVDISTITITKNVTEGINIACWGHSMKAGDEVLMTTHEHVGGCAAWIHRANTEGIRIRTFSLAETSERTFENLKSAINLKTRIIAIPHIPCTIGQILPIKEICDYARSLGITTIIDGAHPLGMIQFNISDLGCDYYSGCLHKWLLAPLGLGFLYIRPDRLEETKIHSIGAYGVSDFDMTTYPPTIKSISSGSGRFFAGTYNGSLLLAGAEALAWYHSIGAARIENRVKELSLFTQLELRKYHGAIQVLSPLEEVSRGAQTTFVLKSKKAIDFITFAKKNLKYTLRHIHEGGLDGVRISTHYYNSEKQIENLILILRNFLKI